MAPLRGCARHPAEPRCCLLYAWPERGTLASRAAAGLPWRTARTALQGAAVALCALHGLCLFAWLAPHPRDKGLPDVNDEEEAAIDDGDEDAEEEGWGLSPPPPAPQFIDGRWFSPKHCRFCLGHGTMYRNFWWNCLATSWTWGSQCWCSFARSL